MNIENRDWTRKKLIENLKSENCNGSEKDLSVKTTKKLIVKPSEIRQVRNRKVFVVNIKIVRSLLDVS